MCSEILQVKTDAQVWGEGGYFTVGFTLDGLQITVGDGGQIYDWEEAW